MTVLSKGAIRRFADTGFESSISSLLRLLRPFLYFDPSLNSCSVVRVSFIATLFRNHQAFSIFYFIHSFMSLTIESKKRKADVLGRLSESSASSGRGATAGWTTCPLCGRHSHKKFALGRGIAAHLHAVHTPWKPGKVERKKRRRLEQRYLAEASIRQQEGQSVSDETERSSTADTWNPTEQEIEEWNQTVLKIVTQLEGQESTAETLSDGPPSNNNSNVHIVSAGLDRNGSKSEDYRTSLPDFLRAAADGNLQQLECMYEEAHSRGGNTAVQALLHTRDRHLSTAEHWVAGSGHLVCLRWIITKQRENLAEADKLPSSSEEKRPKMRRRDGKTALHYSARNGHLECIQFLVEECEYDVNSASGDGTTPFHLACFGAHLDVAKYLLQRGGDDVAQSSNEWKCSAAHWVAMTKNDSIDQVIRFCEFLKREVGVSFVAVQKQGHSPLHKAAQVSHAVLVYKMKELASHKN